MAINQKYRIGQIVREEKSPEEIVDLATKHIPPFQRNHGNKASKKKYLNGVLFGESQNFAAVYVLDLKTKFMLDGFHRADALKTGQAKTDARYPLYLNTHTVQTMDDAEQLYTQYNSLAAAKRSGCYFDSGLRKCGMLNKIISHLVVKGGRATAVQMASGLRGSANTMAATVAMIEGLKFVDNMMLRRQGEISGTLALYLAAAQYCPDAARVDYFIRSVNANAFGAGTLNPGDEAILSFREFCAAAARTGGGANDAVFAVGMAEFVNYMTAVTRRRRSARTTEQSMSLAQFISVVDLMK